MSALIAPRRRPRPAQAPRRHLRVVDEPTRRHTLAYALVMVLVLAGAVFGAVALNALAAGAAVEARVLDQRVAEAERSYAQLVADVAALEDPARIREAAVDQGLVPAGPGRQVVLERNLEADGAVTPVDVLEGTADPLKPLLSVER
jgi:hypothetical protein